MKRRILLLPAVVVGLTTWVAWRPEDFPSRPAARRDSSRGPPTLVSDPAPVERIVPAAEATVSPPGVARGRVLLLSGEPAIGGWIEYWPNDYEWTRVALDHLGRFRIPLGGPREVLLGCDGYGSSEWWIAPGEHEEVVTLGRFGKDVAGMVIDEQQRPVAGIRADLGMDAGAAVTDAAGRFLVRGVTKWFLYVRARDGSREGFADSADPGPLVVQLEPHPSLILRVFEPDRSPAAGAGVYLGSGRIEAREAGVFHSAAVDPGKHHISVARPGWGTFWTQRSVDGTAPVETSIHLPEGLALRGRLVDAAAQPVAGALVGWTDGNWPRSIRAEITTGADGRFLLRGLPDRVGCLEVVAKQHSRIERELRPGLGETTIVMPRYELAGRIEKSLGRRELAFSFEPDREVMGCGGPPRIDSGCGRTPIGGDGRFRIRGLPVGMGPIAVWINIDGYAGWPVSVTPEAGAVLDLGEMRLKGRDISGEVRTMQGDPVKNARVLFHWGNDARQVLCDASGRFQTRMLPIRKDMALIVRAPGFLQLEQTFAMAGTGVLDLRMQESPRAR